MMRGLIIGREALRNRFLILIALVLIVAVLPRPVLAAQITNRALTLSSSSANASNATTTYTFTFNLPTATVIKSFSADICTSASGACVTPTGFSNSAVTISQPTNLGSGAGWTVSNGTAGSLRLANGANGALPTGLTTITFNNVQNPTTSNTSFYARMTTYSDAAYSAAVDNGITAASTATQITLSGQIPESLVFCVGTTQTTAGDCSTMSGSAVNFGIFTSTAGSTGTAKITASSNAENGYIITQNGTTLTSGTNTIAAMGGGAPVKGSSQFGTNVAANTTAGSAGDYTAFGATPTGDTTNQVAQAAYGTADSFKFATGDTIAATNNTTDPTNYTVSYLVNIAGKQAAGFYATTLTYICTAKF